MKTVVLIAAAASLALSACATRNMDAQSMHQLISDFHNAGCGGRVDVDAGAGSGQLGGQAHFTLGLHGECPVGDKPLVVPLKDVGQVLPGEAAPPPAAIPDAEAAAAAAAALAPPL